VQGTGHLVNCFAPLLGSSATRSAVELNSRQHYRNAITPSELACNQNGNPVMSIWGISMGAWARDPSHIRQQEAVRDFVQ